MKVNARIVAAIKSHYIINNEWPTKVLVGIQEAGELGVFYGTTPSEMTFEMAHHGKRTVNIVITHNASEVTCSTNG